MFRQFIRPGDADEKLHEHDASEISGVFGFLRALKVKITGEISSDGWEDGVTGWKLFSNGSAQFNEDVDIGGAGTSTSQLFVHNVSHHVNLLENDGSNYPDDIFVIDANSEDARFFWLDLNGVDPTLNYGGLHIIGPHHATRPFDIDFQDSAQAVVLRWDDSSDQWLFASGTASAPALSFIASGRADDGIYSAAESQLGVSLAGTLRVLFTTSQIQAEDGAASAPAYSFNTSGREDDGIYSPAASQVGIATSGTARIIVTDGQVLAEDGSAAAPVYSFNTSGREDDGIYSPAASQVGIATGGTLRALFTDTQIQAEDGAVGTPAYSFNAAGQTDVGFYRSGTDEISVALNGAQEGVFTTDGFRGIALQSASLNEDVTGYTNTSYADLDALTTAPFAAPVAVTVTTGTSALVMLSAARHSQDTSGTGFVGYRVSGASTIAAADDWALRAAGAVGIRSGTFQHVVTGLTPGVNVFEMQARVTANAGNLSNPVLTVIPL